MFESVFGTEREGNNIEKHFSNKQIQHNNHNETTNFDGPEVSVEICEGRVHIDYKTFGNRNYASYIHSFGGWGGFKGI